MEIVELTNAKGYKRIHRYFCTCCGRSLCTIPEKTDGTMDVANMKLPNVYKGKINSDIDIHQKVKKYRPGYVTPELDYDVKINGSVYLCDDCYRRFKDAIDNSLINIYTKYF